jgi:Flp pilus assembly protein TadD
MPNRPFTILLFAALLIGAVAVAQTSDSADQTATSQPAAAQPLDKQDYSKEAFVVEKLHERYRFESDGTGRKETTFRVHVLSEAGVRGFGQLRFGYNSANDRIEIGYVRVTKADGSVVAAGPEAVQDLSGPLQQIAPVYTDYRVKDVTVPGLRPGDMLESQVTTIFHTPIAPGQFWLQHDFNQVSVVLDEELDIDIPAGRVVKLKNKPGFEPKITDDKGRRIYHWSSSHLVQEDGNKDSDKTKKKKKKKLDDIADVQMTTFSSWEEVGRWYATLEKDRRVPSKEVKAKAQELTKGLNSDLEKTEALYDFVAKNFRYVSLSLGLARYQPQAAVDVLHNQYGDCKDKNTLLAALLEAEGLHSSTVLINAFRKLDPDVPSPSQFDHAITMVPLGKEEIWMDATTEVAPFRLLSYSLRKKQALVIPEGGVPHLEETPADPPTPDRELEEIEGKVDDSGRLEATINFTLRGDMELKQRIYFRHIAAAQWKQAVEGINKALGGEVSNVKISDPAATREPFTISYQVSKGNFVDWSKKKVELRLPLAGLGLAAVSADVNSEDDENDDSSGEETFKLGPPHEHTYRLKLELAPRYHTTAPVPITLDRDYGAYQSIYKLDGNTFTAERKLTIRTAELPPARADDYRTFRSNALTDSAQALRVESAVADTHSVPSDMKAIDLITSGNEARRNGNYGLAIELLNHAVEADPKSKKAWNSLGLAYFDDGQDGLAINAYQKQIELNSFDQNAYNNLGRVYLRERKYEDADKWFQRQVEINPLDKYAHENLGNSLLEQHKYEEAVPELERAASITPNNAHPQVNLGEAYLNLGQDDKAMAAFDKALSISATPSVWNSIAYKLARKKAHLEVARRYAESAVSGTATRLRNISLDQIKQQDIRLVTDLATYWDTLGWVAFAEGNSDAAEKYIAAAWQLNPDGEIGGHLAQLYEKRGDKAEAAHLYALALLARRPETETRARLAALIGGDDKVDAAIDQHRNELLDQRTLKLPNAGKLVGKADFFIVLSNGPRSAITVEGVKLVDGDDGLKSATEILQTGKYNQKFPDETPVKIVRRGTLSCKAGDCTFLMAIPDEVRSVD